MIKISIKVVLVSLTTILFISAHFILQLYYLVDSSYFFGINVNALIVDITFISAIILQLSLLLIIIRDEFRNGKNK